MIGKELKEREANSKKKFDSNLDKDEKEEN